jgi:hypothetical protein
MSTNTPGAVERIVHAGQELALIVRSTFHGEGITFFTPGTYSQQVGYMNRPVGYAIAPHVHNPVTREVQYTKEVLFVRRGSMRVDFYTDRREYLQSAVVHAGDVILLAYGGHGFEMLQDTEIIEVKQGPYCGDEDKTRFDAVPPGRIVIKGGVE